jgi:hypothetical protein
VATLVIADHNCMRIVHDRTSWTEYHLRFRNTGRPAPPPRQPALGEGKVKQTGKKGSNKGKRGGDKNNGRDRGESKVINDIIAERNEMRDEVVRVTRDGASYATLSPHVKQALRDAAAEEKVNAAELFDDDQQPGTQQQPQQKETKDFVIVVKERSTPAATAAAALINPPTASSLMLRRRGERALALLEAKWQKDDSIALQKLEFKTNDVEKFGTPGMSLHLTTCSSPSFTGLV